MVEVVVHRAGTATPQDGAADTKTRARPEPGHESES
jgi:hypothetical protein